MELTCQSVVENLNKRGHQSQVLTSNYGQTRPVTEGKIDRRLYLEMDLKPLRNAIDFFLRCKKYEAHNRCILREHIQRFQPDVVFIWGMWNLHRILAYDAEQILGDRVLYRFGDYWPTLPSQFMLYWQAPARSIPAHIIKTPLRSIALHSLSNQAPIELKYPHSYCISQAVKKHLLSLNVPIDDSDIIYNGLDMTQFRRKSLELDNMDLHKLLYVGRLAPEKGPDIALKALAYLLKNGNNQNWFLTIVGSGSSDYVAKLKNFAKAHSVSDHINYVGQLPASEIPGLMCDHGILIVPSLWEEPFGRVIVDGMLSGCVVIGSETGAIPEIIEHNHTGCLFPPGDFKALAVLLESLAEKPEHCRNLASNGKRFVLSMFDLEKMVDEVEVLLERVFIGQLT